MKLNKTQLLTILKEISKAIEEDDSFEGSLQYGYICEGYFKGKFDVTACYRYGNKDGQGNLVLINDEISKL